METQWVTLLHYRKIPTTVTKAFTSAPQAAPPMKYFGNADTFSSSPFATVWADHCPSVCRCKAMIHPSSSQLLAWRNYYNSKFTAHSSCTRECLELQNSWRSRGPIFSVRSVGSSTLPHSRPRPRPPCLCWMVSTLSHGSLFVQQHNHDKVLFYIFILSHSWKADHLGILIPNTGWNNTGAVSCWKLI